MRKKHFIIGIITFAISLMVFGQSYHHPRYYWFDRTELDAKYLESELRVRAQTEAAYRSLDLIPGKYPKTQQYLQELLEILVQKAKLSEYIGELPLPIISVGSFDGAYFQAGIIHFPVSYLKKLKNMDEVAFILAHELMHWSLWHITKEIYLQDLEAEAKRDGNKFLSKSIGELYRHKRTTNEQEADFYALQVIMRSGFNPSAGIKSLWKCNCSKASLAHSKILASVFCNQDSAAHGNSLNRYSLLKSNIKSLALENNVNQTSIASDILKEIKGK